MFQSASKFFTLLGTMGMVGALCAAEIISHYGARPEVDLKALVESLPTVLPIEVRRDDNGGLVLKSRYASL